MESLFSLKKSQNAGKTAVGGSIKYLIGALILVVIAVSLASTFFTSLGTGPTGLGNTSLNPAVPTWVPTVLIVIVGAGLVFLILRAFDLA